MVPVVLLFSTGHSKGKTLN